MEYQQLEDLYNKLVDLNNAGDGAGAQKLLKENFPQLPEDLQGELLARMYFRAAEEEAGEAEAFAQVQENALAALDILEAFKKKVEAEAA